MAEIKIESVIEHLDNEFRNALEDTLKQFAPQANVDKYEVFRFFLRRVYQRCNTWERIPENLVKP
jgi:hypothetical protein